MLSGTTATLIAVSIPGPGDGESDWSLRDLGWHRLRDLSRPEEVFQLLAPDLASSFPPLRSLDAIRHNLPQQLTNFVGRDGELTHLAAQLDSHRLVTVVGPGGTGKTRLALQGAADLLDRFGAGVWFVDLSPLQDGSLIASTALTALGERERPGEGPSTTLAALLKDGDALLILDNCEHLVAASASLVDSLLRACPRLRVLATSRLPLQVHGEQVLPLGPLSLPATDWLDGDAANRPSGSAAIFALQTCEAVRLFLDRAMLVRPDFRIDERTAAAVASVVRHLDGIPLALELAAVRLRSMTIDQIGARLNDRFHILTGGSRALLARQQTLRAAIDWSYDLLGPKERVLFARLAIFRGGWTLEAAEEVCADAEGPEGGDGMEAWEVVDALGLLVDHSLVVLDAGNDDRAPRYRFLETIQAYARERLNASTELAPMTARHLQWLEGLSAEVEAQRNTPAGASWLMLLDPERDNLRAALEAATAGQAPAGPALAIASRLWWPLAARWGHGREWLQRLEILLDRLGPSADLESLARATYCVGLCAKGTGDNDKARSSIEQALGLARRGGLQVLEAWCLNDLGNAARGRGELALARDLLLPSLALKQESCSPWDVAITLNNLACVAFASRDMAEVRRLLLQGSHMAEEAGAWGMQGEYWGTVGYLDLMEGNVEEARRKLTAADKAARASGELQRQIVVSDYLMVLEVGTQHWSAGIAAAATAWRLTVQRAESRPQLLFHGSWLASLVGDHAMGARLAGCATAAPPRHQDLGIHPQDRATMEEAWNRSRQTMGVASWEAAFDDGRRLTPMEGHREALAWVEQVARRLEEEAGAADEPPLEARQALAPYPKRPT